MTHGEGGLWVEIATATRSPRNDYKERGGMYMKKGDHLYINATVRGLGVNRDSLYR